jgi:hypothetical protein
MYRHFAFIIFLFLISPLFGQITNSPTYWNQASNKSVSLKTDNDTYYLSDYYYSNGLEIKLILPVFNKTPFLPIFPIVSNHQKTISGLSIVQCIYTPKNIRDTTIQFNDRPFAATLEIDHFMFSINQESGLTFRGMIRFGVMGASAGGGKLQRKIHQWIDSPLPNGWNYQIANDIILNYDFLISYPLIYSPSYKFALIGSARAGTLFDDLELGINIASGKNQFVNNPLKENSRKKFNKKPRPFFSADALIKLVFYNATLEGGLFSKNNQYALTYSEISPMVFSANAKVGLLWRSMALSYRHNFITKEFKAGSNHNYASLELMVYF